VAASAARGEDKTVADQLQLCQDGLTETDIFLWGQQA
jgi:hypothetical protein